MKQVEFRRTTPILVYADLEASYDHLVRVFGFGAGRLDRDGEGRPVHAEVQVGDTVVWLHREAPELGLRSPAAAGVGTAMTAVVVDDVDAHFERVREQGGAVVEPPADQPYGVREYSVAGPEGELWSFMQPTG